MSFPVPGLSRRALIGASLLAPAAAALPLAPATAYAPAGTPLARQVRFGAYAWNVPWTPGVLDDLQRTVQAPVSIASYFYGPDDVFPAQQDADTARGGARDLLVAWEIGKFRYSEWPAGLHDAYLDRIAAAARAFPHVLHVRPWPEMNGDWTTFQPTPGGEKEHGGTPEEFIAAWRHWGPWRTFEDIYREQYDRLVALHPTAPVWICEVGCKEPSYDDGAPRIKSASKGRWISDMFASTTFPRVAAVCWFQGKKERDWRVNSSTEALKAIRAALDQMPA